MQDVEYEHLLVNIEFTHVKSEVKLVWKSFSAGGQILGILEEKLL